MPFFRPSVEQIRRRRISDFEYELSSQNARLDNTVENALAVSGAGSSHGLHGHLDDAARNAFPHLADDERLRQWATFFGVYQIEATRSVGTGLFSPNAALDTLLPVGTILTRSDGVEYEVLEDTLIIGANIVTEAPVRARVAGAAGDLEAGADLSISTPVVGISSSLVVGTDIAGGLDEESTEALRTRLLARIDSPPQGGGPGDYVSWAKLVPGVTRAWEYPHAPKVGYVTVLFMRDLDLDPFPDPTEVAAVAAKMAEFAPIIAPAPIAAAPFQQNIALSIDLTIEPGFVLADVKIAIYQAIRDMLAVRFAPLAVDGVLYKSWISEAISSVPGELDHKLTIPVGDLPVLAASLPVLPDAGITWV